MLSEKDSLTDAFDQVNNCYRDSFFVRGTCKYPSINIPLLSTDNLSLPVTKSTISQIRKHCKSSQYGIKRKGMETTHNLDVRHSFEITAQQFHLNDFSLSSKTSSILDKIRLKLSPQYEYITAQVNKLLIYEKDCFFDLHSDTMKSEHHFASLVLSIPTLTSYKGGEFHLYHNYDSDDSDCQKKSSIGKYTTEHQSYLFSVDGVQSNYYDTTGCLPYYIWTPNGHNYNDTQCEWIAFYSDMRHKIEKVTEGIRMTITLDIFYPKEASALHLFGNKLFKSSPFIPQIYDILHEHFSIEIAYIILQYFGDHHFIDAASEILSEIPSAVCLISNHRYGGENVGWNRLKGKDLLWYQWMSRYFEVIITPVLVRNIYEVNHSFSPEESHTFDSEMPEWQVSFGRMYDVNGYISHHRHEKPREHIVYNETVVKLMGDAMKEWKIYPLYDDEDKALSIRHEIQHGYFPENLGNYEELAKEFSYQCFGLLLIRSLSDNYCGDFNSNTSSVEYSDTTKNIIAELDNALKLLHT